MSRTASDTRNVGGLILGWMLVYGAAGAGLIGPNRTAVEAEYGLSHTAFGLAIALVQVACSAAGLALTSRSRSHSPGRVLLLSLWVVVAGYGVIAFTRSAFGMAAGWVVVVVGTVLSYVANSMAVRVWPAEPRRGVLLLHTINGIGKVVGPVIAVAALALYWRWSFAIMGALTAAAAVATWRLLPAIERVAPPDAAGEPERQAQPAALRSPEFWRYVLLFGTLTGAEVGLHTLMPLYYEREWGLSASSAGLLLTVHLAGLGVGRWLALVAANRLSSRRVVGLCLLTGLAAIPALLTPDPLLRCVLLFIAGGMHSATWPTLYAQAAEAMRDNMLALDLGTAFGCQTGVAVCVIAGSRAAEFSLRGAAISMVALVGVFAVLYFTIGPGRLRRPPAPANTTP